MAAIGHTTNPLPAGGGFSQAKPTIQALDPSVMTYLKHLFESHAGPDGRWNDSQIRTFVQEVQGQDATSRAAADLLKLSGLDFSAFLTYMVSPDTAITLPRKEEDLSWPLASYFISSSHNTYLTGNQLTSDSTTGAYTNVLLRGCRTVEIDVWDGHETDSPSSASDTSDDESAAKRVAFKERKQEVKEQTKTSTWSTGAYNQLKSKLPESVTSKMEKTGLGKKLERKVTETFGSAPAKQHVEGEPEGVAAVAEPRVLHGYTITKEVPFRDVCVAIRDSAFAVSDLPLIVSLEVHCNAQQQGAMVRIMKETWEGLMVNEPEIEADKLPSPGDLKRKILVKVKYAPPNAPLDVADSGDSEPLSTDATAAASGAPAKPIKVPKIIQELSRLGIYTKGISFKNWKQPEASMPTHIFSLSEKKFTDHHEKQWEELFNHNKNYLMRTYPSGLRIGSSNLNPNIFWGGGAQVVALNWQQTDEGMMLNDGMFTGTKGYVLKPQGYRPNIKPDDETSTTITRKCLSLAITFLAAQNIPLPPHEKSSKGFRPYIKMELHVEGSKTYKTKLSPSATSSNINKPDSSPPTNIDANKYADEYKLRTKTAKGCACDLQAEKLEFKNIPGLVDELTFLRFTVRDDEIGRDDLAAWACVRLDRLGSGYRFVHLMDAKGKATDGVIFVKVEKTLV